MVVSWVHMKNLHDNHKPASEKPLGISQIFIFLGFYLGKDLIVRNQIWVIKNLNLNRLEMREFSTKNSHEIPTLTLQ